MIKTEELTKQYGKLFALKNLSLELKEGDLFGFIGPNGSGKTTTMKMLATLLQPTWGEAYVCGMSIYTKPKEIRRLVGFMPDFFGVYDDMKVIEYLEFFAAAYRIKGEARRKVCNEALERVDLGYKREALVTSLSRGMTQRLGLARVLLHDPQVLLLDEPASGLDPRARIEIRELLKRLGGKGKTIMVSSHILPELADVCNKVGIIERGELLVDADVQDVMRRVRDQIALLVELAEHKDEQYSNKLEKCMKFISDDPIVDRVELDKSGAIRVFIKKGLGLDEYSELLTRLIAEKFKIKSFSEEEINLETAFMTLTRGITA
ncbi:MAG: ABC transporter ATP-binding protein [Thermoguttaceae bacterium]|jgi:ABC-2 type transport system ATP-binding protein|nr:ABC transporter ATP-binding protein [Thermoguttaceae bacterium]MBR4750353.1 ABC transporter ATP-binding protein [Thermoguttaceae bacterium]MBR5759881.1 ABC transporter ATP-binding protein [Thermoguttaceae bacterium]